MLMAFFAHDDSRHCWYKDCYPLQYVKKVVHMCSWYLTVSHLLALSLSLTLNFCFWHSMPRFRLCTSLLSPPLLIIILISTDD